MPLPFVIAVKVTPVVIPFIGVLGATDWVPMSTVNSLVPNVGFSFFVTIIFVPADTPVPII